MSADGAARPQAAAIENPLSGERITIGPAASPAAGPAAAQVLEWELVLAPGGRVPSSHAHPGQEERFTVLAGQLRFRAGRRRITAGPGDTVVIPPGTVHHFANPGRVPARVAVTTRPALRMRELLQTAAALATEQHAAGRRLPRMLELALFMRDFDREVRAPYLPAALVRAVTGPVTALARRRGLDARYRRLRGPAASPAGPAGLPPAP
ncbi:MAG TPA: cupin domain-containing protein [Streptosporangiaceae bacterium]|jgi:quercetin dioxygenase-like cupin family protein